MKLDKAYINGAWRDAEAVGSHDIVNPATGSSIGTLALSGVADGIRAVKAAKDSFETWSETTSAERKAVLTRVLECYEARQDDLAAAMTLEMGAPKTLSMSSQYGAGRGHLAGFVAAIDRIPWIYSPDLGDKTLRILAQPVGVVVLITPWNWPMNQITLKVGAALAAGCTMVLKPSELAPLSAQIYAEIMDAAKLPPGVFNMVFGSGPELGEALVSHPDVATVSLTGSTRAGVAVSHAAAADVKRVSLELGGKGPCLIFADCDPVIAAKDAATSLFRNSGQSCNAPSRLLVERNIYDQVVQTVAEVANKIVVNDPQDPATEMGPLANKAQFERVKTFLQTGKQEARLVAGGSALNRNGFFIAPTVFADVTNDMTIAQEEIFGPVISIIPFESEDEALKMANDSPYGLTAYLWTENAERACRLSSKLRSGMVRLNGSDIPFGAPFGGFGQSGIGREGGIWGIEEFLETKAVSGWHNSDNPVNEVTLMR